MLVLIIFKKRYYSLVVYLYGFFIFHVKQEVSLGESLGVSNVELQHVFVTVYIVIKLYIVIVDKSLMQFAYRIIFCFFLFIPSTSV